MNTENTRVQLLKQLFATHPGVDKFYLTSDDQAFTQEHHAIAHGNTLEDRTVKPYSRLVVDAVDAALAKVKGKAVAPSKETAPAETTDNSTKTADSEADADGGAAGSATDESQAATTEGAKAAKADEGSAAAEPAADAKAERAKLVARYVELFAKQPTGLSVEKMQTKIAAKEAEPAK